MRIDRLPGESEDDWLRRVFAAKTEERLVRDDLDIGPCLCWTAGRSADGYGNIHTDGRYQRAHRVAWQLTNGPIPNDENGKSLHVLHRCDNPLCCRVEHLFLGTNADNVADTMSKGRAASGERHGRAKLTEANVAEVLRLRAAGWSLRKLAAKFGVSTTQAYRIVNGERWKHMLPATNQEVTT